MGEGGVLSKILFIAILVIALSFVINVVVKGNDKIMANAVKDYGPINLHMGDSVEAGNFEWTIRDFKLASEVGSTIGSKFVGKRTSGVFLIVDMKVQNIGSTQKELDSVLLKVIDENGESHGPDLIAGSYLTPDGTALDFDMMNPGVLKFGKVVFEIPINSKAATLKIYSSALVDNVAEFNFDFEE